MALQNAGTGCGRVERWAVCSLSGLGWQQISPWLVLQLQEVYGHSGCWRHPLPLNACQTGWKRHRGTHLCGGEICLLFIWRDFTNKRSICSATLKSIICHTWRLVNKYTRVNDASIAWKQVLHILLCHWLWQTADIQVGIFYCIRAGPCIRNLATGNNTSWFKTLFSCTKQNKNISDVH